MLPKLSDSEPRVAPWMLDNGHGAIRIAAS